MLKMTKKIIKISSYIYILLTSFLLLTISSCNNFLENSIPENKANEQTASSNPSETKKHILTIKPSFENSSTLISRSAYPNFATLSLSGTSYSFSAKCNGVFDEVEGTYDTIEGTVSFTIYCTDFTEDVEFFIKKSGTKLWYGKKENVIFTQGSASSITNPVYFQAYTTDLGRNNSEDGALPNGNIELAISTDTHYNIDCVVKNKTGETLSEPSVEIIYAENVCVIRTSSTGITQGTYTAEISIYRGDNTVVKRTEIINVWPGLTTNVWYLSDGTRNQNLYIKPQNAYIYVKGSSPTGRYASGGVTLPASYTPNGQLLSPFSSLQDAVNLCTSDMDYKIIVSGTVNEDVTIPETTAANSITIRGDSDTNNDVLQGTGSGTTPALKIECYSKIIIERLKITGGTQAGIYVDTNFCAGLILSDGTLISQNTNTHNMGGGVYSRSPVTIQGATIKQNTADFGGGVYADSAALLMTSGGIVGNVAEYDAYDDGQWVGGAGVFMYDSTFTMTGGTIQGNRAMNSGGGICLVESNFYMSGNSVIGDDSKSTLPSISSASANFGTYGGAIHGYNSVVKLGYKDATTKATLNGGIYFNYAEERAGAIYLKCSVNSLTVSSGEIKFNKSELSGGGIYLEGGSSTIDGGIVAGNYSNEGGGITMMGAKLYLNSKAQIGNKDADNYAQNTIGSYSNYAVEKGGGILLKKNNSTKSELFIGYEAAETPTEKALDEGYGILYNYAAKDGGGIYSNDGCEITMSSGDISYNAASTANSSYGGGGVYLGSADTMTFEGGRFAKNRANKGAAVYTFGTFIMNNGVMGATTEDVPSSSTALSNFPNYGTIFVASGTTTLNAGTIGYNYATYYGSGLAIEGGNAIIKNTIQYNTNGTSYVQPAIKITNNTSSKCTLDGARIIHNYKENGSGYAIQVEGKGSLYMKNGVYIPYTGNSNIVYLAYKDSTYPKIILTAPLGIGPIAALMVDSTGKVTLDAQGSANLNTESSKFDIIPVVEGHTYHIDPSTGTVVED